MCKKHPDRMKGTTAPPPTHPQIVLATVGARDYDYDFDWLEGMVVTTTTGRSFGFGCKATTATGGCTDNKSVVASPPAAYPNAVVGE